VTEREIDGLWGGAKLEDFERLFGTKTTLLKSDDLNRAYESADTVSAKACAKQWIRQARKVIEPSEAELVKSGAMYVGMQDLLLQHQAQAIAIDCLGLFYSQKMSAYPCIYAHCVAMNKVHGPEGKSNPFDIRNHSEDRKGAAVRSLMPLGEIVTTLKFRPDLNLCVMHMGKTAVNIDEDKACRTKLAAEVIGDIDKMLKGWDYGWHRVTFYGDHKKTVEDFCTLKGIEVVHEA